MKTFVATDANDLALVTDSSGKKDLSLEQDEIVSAMVDLYFKFQFFEGEWFLDKRQGTPYYKYVLVKNPDFAIIRRLIRQIIMSTEVVAKITRLDFDYDNATRRLSFFFEAQASDGRKVSGGSQKPYIVDGRSLGLTATGDVTQ